MSSLVKSFPPYACCESAPCPDGCCFPDAEFFVGTVVMGSPCDLEGHQDDPGGSSSFDVWFGRTADGTAKDCGKCSEYFSRWPNIEVPHLGEPGYQTGCIDIQIGAYLRCSGTNLGEVSGRDFCCRNMQLIVSIGSSLSSFPPSPQASCGTPTPWPEVVISPSSCTCNADGTFSATFPLDALNTICPYCNYRSCNWSGAVLAL